MDTCGNIQFRMSELQYYTQIIDFYLLKIAYELEWIHMKIDPMIYRSWFTTQCFGVISEVFVF